MYAIHSRAKVNYVKTKKRAFHLDSVSNFYAMLLCQYAFYHLASYARGKLQVTKIASIRINATDNNIRCGTIVII